MTGAEVPGTNHLDSHAPTWRGPASRGRAAASSCCTKAAAACGARCCYALPMSPSFHELGCGAQVRSCSINRPPLAGSDTSTRALALLRSFLALAGMPHPQRLLGLAGLLALLLAAPIRAQVIGTPGDDFAADASASADPDDRGIGLEATFALTGASQAPASASMAPAAHGPSPRQLARPHWLVSSNE